ncbi:MAG: hypothetical protein QOD00_2372 [Blastocatellia bacterium]|nr:hypothetical protein [Blastocatellia bacterium]
MTLCAAPPSRAQDIKLVTRTIINGQALGENTSYIKGARKRTEQKMGAQAGMDESTARMMPSIAQVYQCDRKRLLQVNDRSKKYTVTMLDEEGSPVSAESAAGAQASGPAETRRGGIVQYTTTITDTGQRQDMFGFKARYLKVVTDVAPGPGACTPKTHSEREGWFIDFQADLACSSRNAAAPMQRPARAGCQDTFRYKTVGTAKAGFPLNVTTTYVDESGQQTTMKQEVVELKIGPLDAGLFDVPAGYTEAKSSQELYGTPSAAEMAATMSGSSNGNSESDAGGAGGASEAKKPGMIRIGVAVINDKSGRLGSTSSLRQQLVDDLDGSELDAISLEAGTTDAIAVEARQKNCDFILYTDIAAIKQSKAGKVGGMFGRAAGVGSGGADKSESRVDFRLVATGSANAQLQSSATAKAEGDEASVAAALTQEAQKVREEARKKM